MSKSILYAANTGSQTVAANGVVNFGSLVRKYGCNAYLSGGNAVVKGCGYYDIETNFTIDNAAAGTVVISLYKDGVAIQGATATVVTVAGEPTSISIPAVIREACNCETTITAVVSATVTITNAAISVVKM